MAKVSATAIQTGNFPVCSGFDAVNQIKQSGKHKHTAGNRLQAEAANRHIRRIQRQNHHQHHRIDR